MIGGLLSALALLVVATAFVVGAVIADWRQHRRDLAAWRRWQSHSASHRHPAGRAQ